MGPASSTCHELVQRLRRLSPATWIVRFRMGSSCSSIAISFALPSVRSYGMMRHKTRAVRVFHEKIRTAEGVIVELKVWQVAKSKNYPEGVKYSFFASQSGKILVGYDNHKPKGHHRHFGGEEEPYGFKGFDRLRQDFARDMETALKALR